MVITYRRSGGGGGGDGDPKPHERYVGFAINVPGIDPDAYARRWGIETGYRMMEEARTKTHSKSPVVRLLCFVYSVCVFNAWVMANAALAGAMGTGAGKPLITQQHFKDALMWEESSNHRVPPEPPPLVLP